MPCWTEPDKDILEDSAEPLIRVEMSSSPSMAPQRRRQSTANLPALPEKGEENKEECPCLQEAPPGTEHEFGVVHWIYCAVCGQVWHLYCAGVEEVPPGAWFCKDCEKVLKIYAIVSFEI